MDDRTTRGYPSGCAVGVTFVELLVTMAVLTIVLSMAVPSFRDMLMNKRISAHRDALFSALNYARNTALTNKSNVQACPISATGSATCGPSWQHGWIIVSQPTAGAPVLLEAYLAGPNDPTLSAPPIAGVIPAVVTFDSRGLTTTQANFKLCDKRGGAYAQSLVVLPTGFVQYQSAIGVAAWDGSALTCP